MNTKFPKNTLEHAIIEFLARFPDETRFNVIMHELTNDGHGWSVNDSWYSLRDGNKEQVTIAARGRWEIFKLNYMPKALVRKLTDVGWENEVRIDCDHTAFLTIRVCE